MNDWVTKVSGCFVSLIPDRSTKIIVGELSRYLRLQHPVSSNHLHCTLIHSMNKTARITPKPHCDISVSDYKLEIWPLTDKGYGVKYALVIVFESKEMELRRDELEREGIKCQYEEFKPHLTLSMDVPKNLNIVGISFHTCLRFVMEVIKDCKSDGLY